MILYPVMLNIAGAKAVVVGGGNVALRKIEDLADSGAEIKVVSPAFLPELEHLAEKKSDKITLVRRKYEYSDIDGAAIVFVATGDQDVNASVSKEAMEKNILVNSADDPENCSFFVPSFTRRGDFILAVSTGGASPALAANLRRKLELALPEDIDLMLEALSEARALLKKKSERFSVEERGSLLREIVADSSKMAALVDQYKKGGVENYVLSLLCR